VYRLVLLFMLTACSRTQTHAPDVLEPEQVVITIPTVVIDDRPVQKPVSRRILIVGDSEACAVNWVVQKIVPQINDEAGQPRDVIDVDCKGGTTVQYWGAQGHLREALSRHPRPDTVLVFLGTNHYGQVVTPPVAQVTDILKEKGLGCVWVGNTAVKGKTWKINKLLRESVGPTCSYFDTEAANIPLPDGVHPDRSGATKWLKAIWPTIPVKLEEEHE